MVLVEKAAISFRSFELDRSRRAVRAVVRKVGGHSSSYQEEVEDERRAKAR